MSYTYRKVLAQLSWRQGLDMLYTTLCHTSLFRTLYHIDSSNNDQFLRYLREASTVYDL
jgi:hypothetical protein